VRFASAVARRRFAHETGVEPVLHVAAQDAVLDEHIAPGWRALVVDVQRTASIGDRAVVDDGHDLGGHLLADAPGECGNDLAIEVTLQAMADRFVEQDSRPARPEHDGHRARGRGHGRELQRRLPRGFAREALPPFGLEIEIEGHTTAATEATDLALARLPPDAG